MHFSTVGSCSDACCCAPRSLGELGRKTRAVRAAGRSWGGSVGESPEMLMTGKARLPYLGASFMEIHARLLCKSFATQGKAINLSESLTSVSQLRRLSLLMFYPARAAMRVVRRAVDALSLGAVKYGFYYGCYLALSSRGASLPEASALDLPALSPLQCRPRF